MSRISGYLTANSRISDTNPRLLRIARSSSASSFIHSADSIQRIYEVGGAEMLIRGKKKLIFLRVITLHSDNIFWHDFFCTTSAHHETFISEVFE